MKTGRHDPCPCGSGRKHKKCCLSKDHEAQRVSQSEKEPEHLSSLPPDPYIEAIDACWNEFNAADYEGQIALFMKTLDEAKLMDGEMAFEMLSNEKRRWMNCRGWPSS